MDKKDELERLHGHADALEKSIGAMDHEIERATHDLANGGDPGKLLSFLQDRHNAQLGLMYDLGKVEAQIERLELLIREEQEQPQERLAADRWQQEMPIAREDHLDWFKESLVDETQRNDEFERAEQMMLQDLEREPSVDDHLDWFPGRS